MHFLASSLSLLVVLGAVSAWPHGDVCTGPLIPKGKPKDPHWMQTIKRQGIAPYAPNASSYKVYRNVKDYGAKGDGTTDDTAAINAAIQDGGRCGKGCASTTTTPAVVFFPAGTYVVSAPLIHYYYTQMIGDAKHRPTLLAASNFTSGSIIDADPYGPDGQNYWINQNNFFRSVRHFTIDLTQTPSNASVTGIHWQVSQATSLNDIIVTMSKANDTAHTGLFMENGSGGYMSDLTFIGGKYGINVGNQQFTVRNLVVKDAQTAVFANWNWGWTFQDISFENCTTGFWINEGGTAPATAGSEVIIDAVAKNVNTFIQTTAPGNSTISGEILLDNVLFKNVGTGVRDGANVTNLDGGNKKIKQWAQGNVYTGTNTKPVFTQNFVSSPKKPAVLLDSNGKIVGRDRTDYPEYDVSQIASARDAGAKGDGVTDDTDAIQTFINKYWACKVLFFDAGTYVVTDTIVVPEGAIIVGEIWTTVIADGKKFSNADKPRPVIQVGKKSDRGSVEISDMIFSARSGSAGAIIVQWNLGPHPTKKAAGAMWDVHIRLGGFAGSGIQVDNCLKQSGHAIALCTVAFIGLHFTENASAYLEGTWVWAADHDIEDPDLRQIDVYSGRGILSESKKGPIWLIGTASEHHSIVQYSFDESSNVYAGLIQTETAYYQPDPAPPAPFQVKKKYDDPTFEDGPAGWGLYISKSKNIFVYGGGLYSFFKNWSTDCLADYSCQKAILKVESDSSDIWIFGLSTVGTASMLNVDGDSIISHADNQIGFAATFVRWTSTNVHSHSAKRWFNALKQA